MRPPGIFCTIVLGNQNRSRSGSAVSERVGKAFNPGRGSVGRDNVSARIYKEALVSPEALKAAAYILYKKAAGRLKKIQL